MSLLAYIAAWLLLFGGVMFILLFGESEMFQGTFIERCHWLMCDGICVGASWTLRRAIGDSAGERVEAALDDILCNRPNPAMQMVYVTLVMGGYYTFCVHGYDLIGAGQGEGLLSWWHRPAISFGMTISIASWLATCWSDPGAIDARNLDAHLAAYPYDYVLYEPKLCRTLKVTCPARSKFCRVTKRRVAKFDHFCGWMNNAIGENNLRHFVTFLALHVVLTSYGAWLCVAVIRQEISRRGLWTLSFEGGKRGVPSTLATDWRLLIRFVAYHFSPLATLALFLVILAIMLGAFLGYHLWMIKQGVTTNETFKWDQVRRIHRRAVRAGETAEAPKGEEQGGTADEGVKADGFAFDDDDRDVGCVGPVGRSADDATVDPSVKTGDGGGVPANIYNKGLRQNLVDVFFPPSHAHARRLRGVDEARASARAAGKKRR